MVYENTLLFYNVVLYGVRSSLALRSYNKSTGGKIMDYKNSGVDIEAGYKSVELMKEHVKKTMRPEVLGGLGGFAGAFDLSKIKEMDEPVLLSGTDGCGTKVKLAFVMDKHDTIGIDAVAMCVNDIACSGGDP